MKKKLQEKKVIAKEKFQTEWNLGLFYTSPADPKIERDIVTIEKAHADFEKKYRGELSYTTNENTLKKALEDYEKLAELSSAASPLIYFYFRQSLNSSEPGVEAEINRITGRLTAASNRVLFFDLSLGKIPRTTQKKFLASKTLRDFHYHLKLIFETARYDLTESEEKILSLKSLPAHSLWIDGADKLLNQQTILFKKENLPLPAALGKVSTLPTKDRRALHTSIMKKLREISHFAEAEINAVYTDKKINDELRGFKEPYQATILSHQTSKDMVTNLVATTTRHFNISHRFHKLKARLLKLPNLEYADRAVSLGKSKHVSFEEGLALIEKSFEKLGGKYLNILHDFLKRGQIDVFPKKGKTGGAFCAGGVCSPTFVLLNHMPNEDSIMTFAHEMGHAFHTEFSKVQRPMYQDYTTAVAEVASTFFENIVFEEIFERLSAREKIAALHDRINDDISTIFRQIACFNFEYDLHNGIRTKGALSKEEISALLNKHMSAYLGPAMKLKEDDGYFFVNWSHIRRFFYVYSYAYGQLISKALYASYRADPKFLLKIEEFLMAGGSKSPEDIFKSIGIDTTKPAFFERGLQSIQDDITRLEKLAKSQKLI
ncbi:MAG: M3 family oligoendopeptidase [Candidatus Pacebacteria bacterium]|nr:M3 family oligoendopeptidase [Candidatus Paceibacterota bacterium]